MTIIISIINIAVREGQKQECVQLPAKSHGAPIKPGLGKNGAA